MSDWNNQTDRKFPRYLYEMPVESVDNNSCHYSGYRDKVRNSSNTLIRWLMSSLNLRNRRYPKN